MLPCDHAGLLLPAIAQLGLPGWSDPDVVYVEGIWETFIFSLYPADR
jgi:hypothetical protein